MNEAARIAELEAKLLVSEAAGAEMREALEYCGCHEHTESPCDESGSHYKNLCEFCKKVDNALSTTCGTAFLAERERLIELLRYVTHQRLPLGDTVFDHLDFERQKQISEALKETK